MLVELSFKFSSASEVEKFLSFLERHVRNVRYSVSARLTHVYVQLQGEGKELQDAVALVKMLAGLARARRAVRRVPLLVLFRDAELARPVPPDAIADALTLSGIPSRVRGSFLETEADYEKVLQVAEELSRLYKISERYPITPHAKRIVVVHAYATGKPVDASIEELVSAGLLNRGAAISLRYPIEETKRRLLSAASVRQGRSA
ncbi:MAG: DUF2067 family protein [Thermoproteaceae archaeon]|nr:DUF2067 family protein [Thermoproteaceae archaeon]